MSHTPYGGLYGGEGQPPHGDGRVQTHPFGPINDDAARPLACAMLGTPMASGPRGSPVAPGVLDAPHLEPRTGG